ncbi:MAG: class II aldolase/adducin family protein [Desulfurococcales archaeon]|nr:class II aldolase/adducin family protein [Desulfurococcales archaeon]MCE4627429.1 class II aldolase/adducin family protein [Desulfurococcales archaeon]
MSWTGDPKRDIVEVMKLLYERGIVQVRGGNASIYDKSSGLVYMSPSGVPRNLLTMEDVAVMTVGGAVLKGNPTSEWRMHLAIYEADPEARAVVHAHPPALLALTYKGGVPDPELLTEVKLNAKCIAEAPYAPPGSPELAKVVKETIMGTGCNVIILQRHGALVYSDKTIYHALDLLEAVEDLSKIIHYLGGPS